MIDTAWSRFMEESKVLTYREIALEQALTAIIGEAIASGLDANTLISNSIAGLASGATYRWVGYPHLENAVEVLIKAHAQAVTWSKDQRPDKMSRLNSRGHM